MPQNSQRSLVSQKSLLDLSCSGSILLNVDEDDDLGQFEGSMQEGIKMEFEIPDTSALMNLSFSSIPNRDLPRGKSFRRENPGKEEGGLRRGLPRGESLRIPRGESFRSRSSIRSSNASMNASLHGSFHGSFHGSISERQVTKTLSGDSSLGGSISHLPYRPKRHSDIPLMVISADEGSDDDEPSVES